MSSLKTKGRHIQNTEYKADAILISSKILQ